MLCNYFAVLNICVVLLNSFAVCDLWMSSVLLIVDTAVPHFPSWMNLASVMLSWKWMFSPAFLCWQSSNLSNTWFCWVIDQKSEQCNAVWVWSELTMWSWERWGFMQEGSGLSWCFSCCKMHLICASSLAMGQMQLLFWIVFWFTSAYRGGKSKFWLSFEL